MILCVMLVLLCPSAFSADDMDLSAAIRLYGQADFQAAREKLSSRIQIYPDDPSVRFWLGKVHFRLRKWDDSIREFEKALQFEPGNANFHLWLGRALGRKAQSMSPLLAFPTARRVAREFETAVRLAPENIAAHMDLVEF